MIEEIQLPEKPSLQTDSANNILDSCKSRDVKKEKCRPMTKVVVRRLPPTMTQEQFIKQIAPLFEHDYLYFAKADMSLGQYAFSRTYINFLHQEDIFLFREKFDNYVFVDAKGTEYPAVVEFAPFQRLPKKRVGKKKDPKCGTIESDAYYQSFLESLKNQDSESGTNQPKTEYSYQPSDSTQKKIITTPLLDYLKQRKQDKQRIREEKREERRRRDLERRRTKDEPAISKVLKNTDLEKEVIRENKENKEDKEKSLLKDVRNRVKKEDKFRDKTRDRDTKLSTKVYKERERDVKHAKKYEEKKFYGKKDDREIFKGERKNDLRDDRKYELKEDFKERKVEEKRGKSYEKMRQEKKKLTESKKQSAEVQLNTAYHKDDEVKKDEQEDTKSSETEFDEAKKAQIGNCSSESSEKDSAITDTEARDLEQVETDCKRMQKSTEKIYLDMQTISDERLPSINIGEGLREQERSKSNENIKSEADNCECDMKNKKETKLVKRRNSLESCAEGGGSEGNSLRRHKSLDGGDQSNLQKSENDDKEEKDKKDPRLERRIRNKDRPAMEIYRPGMGKFSKQRLEREKSSNDDRASLSSSPTPSSGVSNNSKMNKPGSEVRSMTFKRSFNRDNL